MDSYFYIMNRLVLSYLHTGNALNSMYKNEFLNNKKCIKMGIDSVRE